MTRRFGRAFFLKPRHSILRETLLETADKDHRGGSSRRLVLFLV